MSIRMLISPPVTVAPNSLNAKAATLLAEYVNIFPSAGDGTPASTWVITFGRATDWTAIDADPAIDTVFTLPATIDNLPDLKAWLAARTIGGITLAERNRIQALFDKYGVNRTDFVASTPLTKPFRRLVMACLEQDDNFGFGFSF